MKKILLIVLLVLSFAGQGWSANYVLSKGKFMFQTSYLATKSFDPSMSKEAQDGFIDDQMKKGTIAISSVDIVVVIIDECTWCLRAITLVKVSAVAGKLEFWTARDWLEKQ